MRNIKHLSLTTTFTPSVSQSIMFSAVADYGGVSLGRELLQTSACCTSRDHLLPRNWAVVNNYSCQLCPTTSSPLPLIFPSSVGFPAASQSRSSPLQPRSPIYSAQTAPFLLQHLHRLYLMTPPIFSLLCPPIVTPPRSSQVFHLQCTNLSLSSEEFHERRSLCDEQPLFTQAGSKLNDQQASRHTVEPLVGRGERSSHCPHLPVYWIVHQICGNALRQITLLHSVVAPISFLASCPSPQTAYFASLTQTLAFRWDVLMSAPVWKQLGKSRRVLITFAELWPYHSETCYAFEQGFLLKVSKTNFRVRVKKLGLEFCLPPSIWCVSLSETHFQKKMDISYVYSNGQKLL